MPSRYTNVDQINDAVNITTQNAIQIVTEMTTVRPEIYVNTDQFWNPGRTPLAGPNATNSQILVDYLPQAFPPTSNAGFFTHGATTFPYPALRTDPALTSGSYRDLQLVFRDSTSGVISAGFTKTIIGKTDINLQRGQLRVNVFLAGADAVALQGANLDYLMNKWRTIYNSGTNPIDRIDYRVFTLDPANQNTGLPDPTDGGSDYYKNLLLTTPGIYPYAVNIVIGNSITGAFAGALGVTGDIPSAAIPTRNSAIAVALDVHTGSDGLLSNPERDFLALTLAHEAGHFLGLIHVVEQDGHGGFVPGSEPLPDTPNTCTTVATCQADGSLFNLMFPVGDIGIAQENLSFDQRSVMNLQVITD